MPDSNSSAAIAQNGLLGEAKPELLALIEQELNRVSADNSTTLSEYEKFERGLYRHRLRITERTIRELLPDANST